MIKTIDIAIAPERIEDDVFIEKAIRSHLRCAPDQPLHYKLLKKSIDSRKGQVKYILRFVTSSAADELSDNGPSFHFNHLSPHPKEVVIIGAGPCGYFAALRCLELGLRPIILDRGRDVRARRRDLRAIQQEGVVNPNSNYCFGEGGAGTYSDGKLYTRATKRGDIQKILELLVYHGAHRDILTDAHPHIGSNKLPQIIAAIRSTIESHGGEVHFDTKVIDFIIKEGKLLGVQCENGTSYMGSATLLATGHSARDIYYLCHEHGISISFKPFAIGARVEHPQALIDSIQYSRPARGAYLPAAAYSLACQVNHKGVFSFCMCPGGLIVPASTAPGELVVNGMSLSKRDSPFANAALVVTLDENPGREIFGGLDFQTELEQRFFSLGDGTQQAPAQRLTDFMKGRLSATLPDSSYIPGTYTAEIHRILPPWITESLRQSLKIFDKKLKGYYSEEAQLVGLESRTSAPIRINRDKLTLMSSSTIGLFPAGEGAGYAGGILSAALDGERVANAIYEYLNG